MATVKDDEAQIPMLSPRGAGEGAPSPRFATIDDDAELDLVPGIYTAALVARFGGVIIRVQGRLVKVHPFFITLFAVPCFLAQLSAMFALRTDFELDQDIDVGDGHPWRCPLIRLKSLMIILFYIIHFKMLLSAVRQMIFMSNPLTWAEVKQPTRRSWLGRHDDNTLQRFAFSNLVMLPCVMVSLMAKFAVGYMVCVDSVSLILASSHAQETIFNCLAITFITELDQCWWECLCVVFHLRYTSDCPIELLAQDVLWNDDGSLTDKALEHWAFPGFAAIIVRGTTFKCLERIFNIKRTILSRTTIFKKIEIGLALITMWFIFKRQLLVLLYALDTRVLPVTRDVCLQYRLHSNLVDPHTFLEWLFLKCTHRLELLMEGVILISARQEFENIRGIDCSDHKYDSMGLQTEAEVQTRYPKLVGGCCLIMMMFFVLPHILISLHKFFFGIAADVDDADVDEEQQRTIDQLEQTSKDKGKQIMALEQKLSKLLDGANAGEAVGTRTSLERCAGQLRMALEARMPRRSRLGIRGDD